MQEMNVWPPREEQMPQTQLLRVRQQRALLQRHQ